MAQKWMNPDAAKREKVLQENSSRFATMIRQAREAKGWTYAELAREIWGEIVDSRGYVTGRNRGIVPRWESGEVVPRPQSIKMIAEALDISESDLAAARQEAEDARKGRSIPAPEFSAGSVAGRPDLVLMSLKAIVTLEEFARIAKDVKFASDNAKEMVEGEMDVSAKPS